MKFSFLKTENKWFVLIFTICAVLIIVIGLNHFYLKTNQESISLQEVTLEEESLEVSSVETPITPELTLEEPLSQQEPSPQESLPQAESPQEGVLPQEVAPKVEAAFPPKELSPADIPEGRFVIQVASFRDKSKADGIVKELQNQGFSAYTVSKDLAGQGLWYRVWIGEFSTKEEVTIMLDKVRKKYKDSFIKPL
jgi:cell division protein FtsN